MRQSERPSDVADALAKRLAENPNDRQAYRALVEHYRGIGDHASLANLIAGFAAFTTDDAEASRAYQEVAEVLERAVGDEKRAEGFYRSAVERDPHNLDASEGLHSLLARAGRLRDLTEVITEQLETLERHRGDPRDVALLAYRLGELWNKHFDRGEDALVHYRKAYETDPKLLRAIYEARLLHMQRGELRAAAALYEKEAAGEPELPRKVLLLRELGALYGELDDLDGAVSALERARALAPSDVELTHALAGELLRRSKTLDARMLDADLARIADLLCEVASALPDDEAQPFLRSALTHAPWHTHALSELEQRTTDADRGRALAPHWVAYLAQAPEGPDADRRRVALARAYIAADQVADAEFCLAVAAEHGMVEAQRLLSQLRDVSAEEPPPAAADLTRVDAHQSPRDPELVTQLSDPSEFDALIDATAQAHADAELVDDEVERDTARPQNSPDDAFALHRDMTSLLAQGRADDALAFALRIVALDPSDDEAFALVDRHYRRNRDFAQRARLLARSGAIESVPLATRKLRLREAVNLFETRLADVDGALATYDLLATIEPHSEDVTRGKKRLLERTRRWEELASLLESEADTLSDVAAKIPLLRKASEIHRRERGDRSAAARTLQKLVALDANDRAAGVALTEELVALERFSDAATIIEQRIAQTTAKPERLPLLRQLATLLYEHVADHEAAFAVCERILEIVPDDVQALDRMEEIDESHGAHARLLTTLERRAQHATKAQAADLYVRMATLAEADLLDQAAAAEMLRQALTLAPSNLQILTALSNLYERAGRDEELIALLRERVEGEKNNKARADMYRRIGRLLAQRLDDQDGAAEAFAKVLEIGDDREALLFMEQRQRAAEAWAPLATTLGKLVELSSDDDERRERLLDHARLLEQLGKPSEAIDALLRVLLDLAPDDAEAFAELMRLSDASSDQRGVSRVLEQRLQHAPDAQARDEAAHALADLYETKLPDETRALRALTEWATALPDDAPSRRRLAALLDRKRRHKELVAVLDELARVEDTHLARLHALQQGAELCLSKLKDEEGAWERTAAWVRATTGSIDPAAIELARRAHRVAELANLCEAEGRHDELFGLLHEQIAAQANAGLRAPLQRRLAAALIEHAQDEAGALQVYEALLQAGDDAEALRFVQAWALRHEDPERLQHALERLARIEPNAKDRRDLFFERGRVLRAQLRRAQDAIASLEEALAIDGRFEPALDELISACEAAPDHAKLAVALERKLGMLEDFDDKLATLQRLLGLYLGPLNDERRALHALDRWAALDVDEPEPLRKARKLHERAGRWRELLSTLDALAERETDSAAQIEAVIAAAELARHKLNDADAAFERLSPLVPLEQPQADSALFELAAASGRDTEAYDLFERAERYEDLAARLQDATVREQAPAARAKLWKRAARLLLLRVGDDERAAHAFERVLELEEDLEALRFMQARARATDDVEMLASTLQRLAAIEADAQERRDLLYEYAHLLNLRLGRSRDAILVLREIVTKLDPSFEPALDELASAAQVAGDDEALAEALEGMLSRTQQPEGRAELAERLSELYEGPLQSKERAAAALRAWAAADPTTLSPWHRLSALLRGPGQPRELIACLDQVARLSEGDEARGAAQLEAACVARDALQDRDEAWRRLLPLAEAGDATADGFLRELASSDERQDELCALYERVGRFDDLVELLRQRAECCADDARKVELYLRCARVLAQVVGDDIAATEAYREVLELREDPEALSYLRTVAERLDDVEALEDVLRRLAAVRDDREEKRDLMLARALLLNDRLDRTAEAVEVLRLVVSTLDPSCIPAIDELVAASEAIGNLPALAQGLERKLVLSRNPVERSELSLRLADLYEAELSNPDLAAEALRRHCEAAPQDVQGYRRLRVHLERQKRPDELVPVLDALSRLEATKTDRHEALLTAAKLAHEALSDSRGAFARLAPLVHVGDPEAERLAETICKAAGLGRELVAVYLSHAQQTKDREAARAGWRKVMRVHESWLHEPAEAFEASLRLLALDTHDRSCLDEVDRLGTSLQAFQRLAQVYGKLVKDASAPADRVDLLLRLATLFEIEARDPNAALDVLMEACRLDPENTRLLDRAEDLTRRLGNHTDLLWLQEQRAARMQEPARSITAWLDAARTADIGLSDREQANLSVRRALELTEAAPEMASEIEALALELDRARPALGKDDARRSLVRMELELCERAREPFRVALMLRAARFLREQLSDDAASFDVLRQGTSAPPFSETLLVALEETAVRVDRLDALNAHLARAADRASGSAEKLPLLARRARVLHEKLGRFDQAAQAYERMLELDPDNEDAASQLFACLKKAGRYRELLNTFERRAARASNVDDKLALMRGMASLWEIELKNRASAIEVWNEVRAIAPHDEEAERAIARLGSTAQV